MTQQTEDTDQMEEDRGFRFKNDNLTSRCKDVFGCLDALEQKHEVFERQRKTEDADIDKSLILQGPSSQDMEDMGEDFKKPTSFSGRDYHHVKKGGYHGRERSDHYSEQFKKPQNRPGRGRFGRGRGRADYQRHPENWTRYSLEDVDISDSANKQAAFAFLDERRQAREASANDESVDLESSACSRGFIAFKRQGKSKSSVSDSKDERMKSGASSSLSTFSETLEHADVDMPEDMDDTESGRDGSEANGGEQVTNELRLFKRKLDEYEEASDDMAKPERNVGFKNRKMSKRSFRARRDQDDEIEDSG